MVLPHRASADAEALLPFRYIDGLLLGNFSATLGVLTISAGGEETDGFSGFPSGISMGFY